MNSKAITKGSLAAIAQQKNQSLAESFLSAELIAIVDMSGSMAMHDAPGGLSRFDAAEKELKALQAEMPGQIAVICFSDRVQFCPGGVPIRFGNGTNMAGALRFVHMADGVAKIVLISDGEPDCQRSTLKEARRFKHSIDTIYIGPEGERGQTFLQQLAQATGGTAASSKEPGLLANGVKLLLGASA